jgi:LPXTG-motif cell wall-anchored protein
LLQIVIANSRGVVSFTAVIPLTMSTGEHTIAIIDSSGNGWRQTIAVTQQLLPATGSDTTGLILFALLLLVGGLILVSSRFQEDRPLSGRP